MTPSAEPHPATEPISPSGAGRPAGLTSSEAESRLAQYGPNRYVPEPRRRTLVEVLRVLADPMALMLVAASALSFAAGARRDAIVLLAAIVPVLGVDVLLEARSRRALRKLAEAVAPRARVLRDGIAAEIPTERVVPGDVLLVREGDVFHADGEIAWSANLTADESMLTGESDPVEKPGGARFFAGSRVLTGQGGGVVGETGLSTEYGRIARMVADTSAERTPIQQRTDRLVGILGRAALAVAAAVFVLALWRGKGLGGAFVSAISVAMAAMPEEFPLVFTIFLSLGAWRLARRRVLVRRIASVETLGSTTVICTDKTGTLTRGEFALEAAVPFGTFTEADLLEAAVLACEIDPTDPIEVATIEFARGAGLDPGTLHAAGRLIRDHGWDAVGKHMSHVWSAAPSGSRGRDGSGSLLVAAKGAFEGILEHCELDPAKRREAGERHDALAASGLRLLAVAGKKESTEARGRADDEAGLSLLGFLGFRDPLRPEIAEAVAQCRTAGIRIKLVTGDHPVTARNIAEAAGIAADASDVVTGDALAALDPPEFDVRVARSAVFARIRPEQKHAIVDSLRRGGEIVAMAGDGINDAPALARASIGISMGESATEVARAAADLVLLDDDFGSIVATVREGRRIYENLEKAFRYLMAFHVPIVVLAVAVPVLGMPLLLLPVHLVWLELVVHPVSALLFEAEPADPDVMRRPPRSPVRPILDRRASIRSVATGAALAAVVLLLYAAFQNQGEEAARGVALAALLPGTLGIAWAERAGDRSWRDAGMPRTARFWLVVLPIAVSLPFLLGWGPTAAILHARLPTPGQWVVALAAAAGAVGWRAFRTGSTS